MPVVCEHGKLLAIQQYSASERTSRSLEGANRGAWDTVPSKFARFPVFGDLSAYSEYSVAEEDRLGRSAAAPVHLSGFIRCTVR